MIRWRGQKILRQQYGDFAITCLPQTIVNTSVTWPAGAAMHPRWQLAIDAITNQLRHWHSITAKQRRQQEQATTQNHRYRTNKRTGRAHMLFQLAYLMLMYVGVNSTDTYVWRAHYFPAMISGNRALTPTSSRPPLPHSLFVVAGVQNIEWQLLIITIVPVFQAHNFRKISCICSTSGCVALRLLFSARK